MRSCRDLALTLVAAAALLGGASARGEDTMSFKLASEAFLEGQPIPRDHTCDGADRSPALHWEDPPSGTQAFALIVDDPDAPIGNWNHWLLYNVPAGARALAAAVAATPKLGDGSLQGTNDFGRIGYGGPCPPHGSNHRYYFKLYALSAPLALRPGAKRNAVLKAIGGNKLAEAQLMGRYGR
jgi:Raf kinase inhibitor-like YbhB/YbcL family protein